jgi:hypothetical protein
VLTWPDGVPHLDQQPQLVLADLPDLHETSLLPFRRAEE